MKHIINILLAVLVFGSASAQMVMDKGYIKMEMTDISSSGAQSAEVVISLIGRAVDGILL